MKVDINKKYQTRDGREVRIYAVDGESNNPVHGAVKGLMGNAWFPHSWCAEGNIFHNTIPYSKDYDLIEIKSQNQQLIDLLERGEKVLCKYMQGNEERFNLLGKEDLFINSAYEHPKQNITPVAQSELDSMSFEKLINKEVKQ